MGLIRMLGHEWAWPTFHLENELAFDGVDVCGGPIVDHGYLSFPVGPYLEPFHHLYVTPIINPKQHNKLHSLSLIQKSKSSIHKTRQGRINISIMPVVTTNVDRSGKRNLEVDLLARDNQEKEACTHQHRKYIIITFPKPTA